MQRILLITLKAAVSIGLLYFALRRTDFGAVSERLYRLNAGWTLLAFAVLALQIVLVAVRWSAISERCGAAIRLSDASRLILIGSFFNQVLPSTVGGDAVRIWLLARDGAGWAKATHSVLLDRFVGLLALAVLVTICLPWSLSLITDVVGRAVLLLIGLGAIAAGAAFLALGGQNWGWMQKFWATRQVAQLAQSGLRLFSHPSGFFKSMGLSLVVQVLAASLGWILARAIGAPFGLGYALLLLPPVTLITTIPISIAGWGVRESTLMLAFVYAGLPPSDGFLISILLGAVNFVVGIIGGAIWLIGGRSLPLTALRQSNPPAP